MWRMLQQDEPDDYVVATGEMHIGPRVRARSPSASSGSTGSATCAIDERYFRPTEVDELCGDASKARARPRLAAADRRSTSSSGSCSRPTCARPGVDPSALLRR